MARYDIGDLDDELARVRELRAQAIELAAAGGERRETFGTALEQFEQLLRSAAASPPTTSPLPLFYALSQAGRAIAAARHTDDDRWSFRGHGIHGPEGAFPPILGDTILRISTGGRGAFRIVSEATGSPVFSDHELTLGDLWASLPQMPTVPGLGDGALTPIVPRRQTSEGESWSFETSSGFRSEDVYRLKDTYPALGHEDGPVTITQDDPSRPGGVRGGIHVPLGKRPLAEVAESYLSEGAIYVRPAVNGNAPPSILMSWWAILFALSQLVRYEPAAWAAAISPDRSVLAVPIETALRDGQRVLPKLVVHALTDRWV